MRIAAFTKTTAIGPSSRYRYYQFVEPLRSEGIDLAISPLFGRGWFAILRVRFSPLRRLLAAAYTIWCFTRRALALLSLGPVDLVVIEHQLFPYLGAAWERRLVRSGRRVTIEFDDAIYLTWRHREKLEELCRIAARAVVGNRFLAEFATRAGGRAEIVPTTLDVSRYGPVTPRRIDATKPFVIGWIGLPYNFGALAILAGPLRRLGRELGRPIELRVVSSGAPEVEGVPVVAIPWSEDGEIAAIREFHVGVMPLADTEWSRGKCALKIVQYFAAGVPVVASRVGVNADIVAHGVNGMLARSEEEWYESLLRIATNPSFAEQLGAAGRGIVQRDFSRDAWVPKLASIWRAAALPDVSP